MWLVSQCLQKTTVTCLGSMYTCLKYKNYVEVQNTTLSKFLYNIHEVYENVMTVEMNHVLRMPELSICI